MSIVKRFPSDKVKNFSKKKKNLIVNKNRKLYILQLLQLNWVYSALTKHKDRQTKMQMWENILLQFSFEVDQSKKTPALYIRSICDWYDSSDQINNFVARLYGKILIQKCIKRSKVHSWRTQWISSAGPWGYLRELEAKRLTQRLVI